MAIELNGTTGITTPGLTNTGTETIVNLTTTGNTILGDASTDTLNVGNGGLVKDAAGNVGVGVPPSAWSSTYKAIQMGAGGSFSTGSSSITYSAIGANYFDNGASRYIGTGAATLYAQNAGQHIFYTAPLGTAGNAITFTQAMTLTASGRLMLGIATPVQSAFSSISYDSGAHNSGLNISESTNAGSNTFIVFQVGSAGYTCGAIQRVGSTAAVTYGTSSDYRLKEDIAPMTGALDTVAKLKPVTYIWKEDGSDGQGFIAHELAEVCPDAVQGKKDAVDAEGNPVYQGIDTSFLVATLTAAIQEQQAMIDELKAKVAALEAA
jgi:hypothetical protein